MAWRIGPVAGVPVDDSDPVPALVPLITVSATALFFLTDQHWEVLRGLAGSYRVWQPAGGLSQEMALLQVAERLSDAFVLALRVSAPFIIYGVVVNLAIGLATEVVVERHERDRREKLGEVDGRNFVA